jgi:hypothetical protein
LYELVQLVQLVRTQASSDNNWLLGHPNGQNDAMAFITSVAEAWLKIAAKTSILRQAEAYQYLPQPVTGSHFGWWKQPQFPELPF